MWCYNMQMKNEKITREKGRSTYTWNEEIFELAKRVGEDVRQREANEAIDQYKRIVDSRT